MGETERLQARGWEGRPVRTWEEQVAKSSGRNGREEVRLGGRAKAEPLAPRGDEVGRGSTESRVGQIKEDGLTGVGEADGVRAGEAVAQEPVR